MEEILKLERLKLPNATSSSAAENIFREISKASGALVTWEQGCKTLPVRKEPCIKIGGPEESVKKAKEMLLERMEIQNNRVVMKIDVTHLEHSSLIGKGGKLIKKVMDCTDCHIHFPDANKCSGMEKSNHVSIYGEPLNVERARIMLRALIPLQIYFEVPSTSCFAQIFETFPQESKFLANPFGLLIYSAPGPNGGTIIVVRCNQDQFPSLRKEIGLLMELVCCTNGANSPPVHIQTDIVHHHQPFVKGNNFSNIETIMKKTGAKIAFPDSPSSSERNSVQISGNLDCVYMAWQEIMNILPVSVSFDVNETRETNGDYLNFLRDCGISVYSRLKPKYYIKTITVKGPEKFSKQILQYRQHLLHLPSLNFKPDIQEINLASNFLSTSAEYHSSGFIPPSVATIVTKNIAREALNRLTQSISTTNILEPPMQKQLLDIHKLNGYCLNPNLVNNLDPLDCVTTNNNWMESIPLEPVNQGLANLTFGPSSLSPNPVEDMKQSPDSCNLFLEEKSSESLAEDYYRKKVLAARAMRRPIVSMESAQVPSSLWAGYGFSQSMPASVIKEGLDSVHQYSYFNYENGGSRSSSEDSDSWENVVLKDCLDGSIWSHKKETTFSHSNYFDFLRNMPVPFDYVTKDILPELLWHHGLHKYIDIFTKEEIDYQTFLMLTDEDLQTLGIAHQARMQMVCLIRELQDAKMKKFDAAPGAGRKF